jgi:hypothetical protein
MSQGPWRFRKTDFKRAVEAAKSAGLRLSAVRVTRNGDIELVQGEPPQESGNELDRWLHKRDGKCASD